MRLAADWADRIDVVHGSWLPTGDKTEAKQALVHAALVRPDGYLAWVAPGSGGLSEALQRWFGSAPAELAARAG
jgi:bifunctional hydroxylase/dehydrase